MALVEMVALPAPTSTVWRLPTSVIVSVPAAAVTLSPLLAPTIGSFLIVALGWRWIFVLLAAIASAILAVTFLLLPEGH